jgi:hypothetical protein
VAEIHPGWTCTSGFVINGGYVERLVRGTLGVAVLVLGLGTMSLPVRPAQAASMYTIHVTPTGCNSQHYATNHQFDPTGTSPALAAPVTVRFINDSTECEAFVTFNGSEVYLWMDGTDQWNGADVELDHPGNFPYAGKEAPSGTYAGEVQVVAPKPPASPKPVASRAPTKAPATVSVRTASPEAQRTTAPSRSAAASSGASPSATSSVTADVLGPQPRADASTTAVDKDTGQAGQGVSPLTAIGLGLGAGLVALGGGALLMRRTRSRSRSGEG